MLIIFSPLTQNHQIKAAWSMLYLGLPNGRYFTGLAGISLLIWQRPLFWKSVPEAGILKINNLPQLQKDLTPNFSNYNSSSESCQDSSFSEVYLLLLTQSLVRFSRHTHRNVVSQPKCRQIINCGLTVLIVSLFSLCRLRITTKLRSGTADKSKWPVFLQNASGKSKWPVFLQNACGNPSYTKCVQSVCQMAAIVSENCNDVLQW